jgi:hypothetical protein
VMEAENYLPARTKATAILRVAKQESEMPAARRAHQERKPLATCIGRLANP